MSYTLHYFDLPGRAEVSRLLFTIGNIPFKDATIKAEVWQSLKPQMPFGQVPVLDVDGKRLAQMGAIDRYVAKLTGMYPADPWDAAQADQAYEFAGDLVQAFTPTYSLPPEEKLKKRAEIVAGPLQEKLKALSRLLEGKQYVAGNSLSHGDLALFVVLSTLISGWLDGVPKDLLEPYLVVTEFRNRVASVPSVKAYYEPVNEGMRMAFKPNV